MNVRRLVGAALATVAAVAGPGAAEATPERTALIAFGQPLTVADERGGVRWQGPDAAWPAWSPDGTRLAFTTATGVSTLTLATGEVDQVDGYAGAAVTPDWSPDGSAIAFSGTVGGTEHRELFVAPATGCCARQVTAFPPAGNGTGVVRWAPDGRRVVVGVELAGEAGAIGDELFVVDPGTGTTTKITGQVPGEPMFFDVSPIDGTVAVVVVGGPASQRLWRVGLDGSSPRAVAVLDAVVPAPAWSPDGRWIAVALDEGLVVLRPDGSGRRVVAPDGGVPVAGPSWFPDGRRRLAYVTADRSVVVAGLDDGLRRSVATDVDPVQPAVAPVFVPVG